MARGGGGSARGYRPGEVYLRPGSRPERMLDVLRRETLRVGHALTVAELRDVAQHELGEEMRIADVLKGLRRRGLVIGVAGRTGTLQYCATSSPVPAAQEADLHAVIEEIVVSECARTGYAVSTEVITAQLSARGLDIVWSSLGGVLETLRTRSEARAVADQIDARLECIHEQGEFWLRAMRFWRPAGTTYPTPIHLPPSRSIALRMAVSATTESLGWVPTAPEVKAWLAVHSDAPAARTLATRKAATGITSSLRTLSGADPDGAGGLQDETSPMATAGGVLMRVGLGSRDRLAMVTARFIDFAYVYRPADELESVNRLREEASTLRLPALATLADVRKSALMRTVLDGMQLAVGDADIPWSDIEARLRQGIGTLTDWWVAIRKSDLEKPPLWLEQTEPALASVVSLRQHLPSLYPAEPLGMIGGLGVRSRQVAAEWIAEVLAPEGRVLRNPMLLTRYVRRVPNPARKRGPLYDELRVPNSHLDVGDVLLRLASLATHARLVVLLQAATDLLGHAVRDPGPLRWLLRELPGYEELYRHGAVIALAALGAPVNPRDALRRSDDEDGLTAYALALALSTMSTQERASRMLEVRASVSPRLRSRVEEMVDRLRAGDGPTVIW